MHQTIAQPPPAAAPPRPFPDIAAATREARCGTCWAEPAEPCGDARGDLGGLHLARFARACRRGLLTTAEMDAVLEVAGDVFTDATLIQDGAR